MREITYLEAVREALAEEMRRDPAVVLLGEDIQDPFGGVYKATLGLQTEFGELRVRPSPISEAGFVGVGTGAALTGLRPVVEVMLNDFLALAMDQLANHAAKLHYMTGGQARVPLTIRTVAGGNRGSAAQHSQHLEAWTFHVPGLKLAMPSTAADAKAVLKAAIRDDNPVIVYENSNLYYRKFLLPDDETLAPIGTARMVRAGSDVTVVATSRMVSVVEEAADTAAERNISLEVIDLRWLQPWDERMVLDSVEKTGRLIVAHDAVERGGVGAEIVARVAGSGVAFKAPPQRVASPNTPVPFAAVLEQAYARGVAHVLEKVDVVMTVRPTAAVPA
jgi:pyruvate/2-oxoglutarate/acetoin dehydrogenase E1 component